MFASRRSFWMPPDKASLLFSVTDQIAQLTRELLADPPPHEARAKALGDQLRALMLDYDHAETMWILSQPEPPRPLPYKKKPPQRKPSPPPVLPEKTPPARRFKKHPWYGFARKPKGSP